MIRIDLSYDDLSFASRIDYVWHFISNHPSTPKNIICTVNSPEKDGKRIVYSDQKPIDNSTFWIPRQSLLFQSKIWSNEQLSSNRYLTLSQNYVYSVESLAKIDLPFFIDLNFGFDIMETLFFHLSRYEEYHCSHDQWNEWDMMKEKKQWLIVNGLADQPQVDILVEAFWTAILGRQLKSKSILAISHDIDHIEKFTHPFSIIRKLAGHVYNRKTLKGINDLLKDYYQTVTKKKEDPYDTFDWMLTKADIEKKIYYLIGGKHTHDTPTVPNHPIFQKSLHLSRVRRYEVGLHPSYETWQDQTMMENQKILLEASCKESILLSRQHYLHFDLKKTPEILINLGIKEDSTLAYNRHLGFRCGTGFKYKLYDFSREKEWDLWEDPLVFMDSSCLHYSNHDPTAFLQNFRSFFKQNQYGTRLHCNFHNSTFDEAKYWRIPLKKMYLDLIQEFTQE